jgi:SAM-dependent methyltransferase
VNVHELAQAALARGEPVEWFEELYANARSTDAIPWAQLRPHPLLAEWLRSHAVSGRALVVGCGLGDDAEGLAAAGLDVMAFDVSPSAIAWCRRRFPGSRVRYEVADAFALPAEWAQAFDFVLEIHTVQALPPPLQAPLAAAIAATVAPGGTLLAIARGRTRDAEEGPPWPLTADELRGIFPGLAVIELEELADAGEPNLPRLRMTLQRI